ncbi:response regulator [Endozoicomonas sp. SM1973]|uniref:Response regulator n=1 Tax=Spartinivicinus marinus TaxID=2994442 RepID=A0A853I7T1_9GAMM|nr:response regulator [Spartinivicinus marinus]MCX4028282.1 response regulator [Spartinivicinus marinus]NYZ65617.1 response regulator [Spartinivicinus marinus]
MNRSKMLELLLIEDNECDVELARVAFERCDANCNINVVNDGVEGIRYLKKEGEFESAAKPSIILLDLNMPKMSGASVLEFLKNDEDLRSIPVIIFSTSESKVDIIDSYTNNASCYIVKPFIIRDYISIVNQIISYWLESARLPKTIQAK